MTEQEWAEMYEPEPLCDELGAAKVMLSGRPAIKHPLVNEIFYTPVMHRLYNRQLAAKREAIERAKQEKRWGQVIWLHEKPWRFQALAELSSDLNDATYFSLLGDVWIDSENVWQHKPFMRSLLFPPGRNLGLRPLMMSRHDRRVWKNFPDEPFSIYRGCQAHNKRGWSWSFHPSNATWFAKRFNQDGIVLRGTVARKNIVAYFTTRNEEEVICDPRHVRVVETAPIQKNS